MFTDVSGGLWLIINVAAVAILGLALVYGTIQWRTRRKNRVTEQQRDRATDELYHRKDT
jgi:hypothetical protein